MPAPAAASLQQQFPFEPRFMHFRGMRIHYVDEGPREAPVLLCCHGFPAWSFLFRHQLRDLRADWRVVAFDLPGFGCSEGPDENECHLELIGALLALLGIDQFNLLAHGTGVMLGCELAAEMPGRLLAACLVSGSATSRPMQGSPWHDWLCERARDGRLEALFEDLDTLLPGLVQRLGVGAGWTPAPASLTAYVSVFRAAPARTAALRLIERTCLVPEADLPRPTDVPALLIHGSRDQTLDTVAAEHELGALFPNHRCVRLPGVGHFVPEEAGDLLSSLLAAFLNSPGSGC